MEPLEISNAAHQCRDALERQGIKFSVTTDPAKARAEYARMNKPTSAMLDTEKNVFTRKSGLWVFACMDEEPIMACGARLDDLGAEHLGLFLERALPIIFGSQVEHAGYYGNLESLTGRAVYLGDLKASTNRLNVVSIDEITALNLFSAYAQYVVFEYFKAEFTYCFLRLRDSRRHSQYGFLSCDPFPFVSEPTMYEDGNPGWIATLSRRGLGASIGRIAENRHQFHHKISTSERRLDRSKHETMHASSAR